MATSLHRIYDNFIWRIETITPTYTSRHGGFRSFDPTKETVGANSGSLRKFFVEWNDSGKDFAATNVNAREAPHTWMLTVFYPIVQPWKETHHMILLDRHDLLTQLRDDRKRVGYNADNTTTDIGLYQRRRLGDQLIKDEPKLWRLLIEWECKTVESEI